MNQGFISPGSGFQEAVSGLEAERSEAVGERGEASKVGRSRTSARQNLIERLDENFWHPDQIQVVSFVLFIFFSAAAASAGINFNLKLLFSGDSTFEVLRRKEFVGTNFLTQKTIYLGKPSIFGDLLHCFMQRCESWPRFIGGIRTRIIKISPLASGRTAMLDNPVLIQAPKLSNIGSGQCLDGKLLGKP